MNAAIKSYLICALSCFAILLFSGITAMAAQFTADVTRSPAGLVTKSRLYAKDSKYLMDLKVQLGPDLKIIVDQKAKKTTVLVPRYKAYIELPENDETILMYDPFQSVEYMGKQYSVKKDGSEKISGHGIPGTRYLIPTKKCTG